MSDFPNHWAVSAAKNSFNDEKRAAKKAWKTMIGDLVIKEIVTGNFPIGLNMSFNDVWADESSMSDITSRTNNATPKEEVQFQEHE